MIALDLSNSRVKTSCRVPWRYFRTQISLFLLSLLISLTLVMRNLVPVIILVCSFLLNNRSKTMRVWKVCASYLLVFLAVFLPQTGYYLLPLMHVLCVFQACLAGLLTDIMEYQFLPCLLFVNPISFPGNHVPFLCGKLVMNPFLIVLWAEQLTIQLSHHQQVIF